MKTEQEIINEIKRLRAKGRTFEIEAQTSALEWVLEHGVK